MSANPFFSGRIPFELLDRIKQRTIETGETKTDILIKALSAYVDFPVETRKPQNLELWEAIAEIRERLAKLENQTDNTEITSVIAVSELSAEAPQNEITTVITVDNQEITNSEINAENEQGNHELENSSKNLDNSDNTLPISDNEDIHTVTKQLSLLEGYSEEYKDFKNSDLKGKIIKTTEVAKLPGLESEETKQLEQKLRNAKSQRKTPIKIGPYLLDSAGKEPRPKGALLWKILEVS